MKAVSFGFSHVGNVRQRNEDAWLTAPPRGLWAVCDGMGGHDAGDYAARYIVDRLDKLQLPSRQGAAARLLAACLMDCNRHLVEYARSNVLDQVGSTVVVLYLHAGSATVLWAGDSRAYRMREGRLRQIGRDHSYTEEADTGAALSSGMGHVITRAVGAQDHLRLDLLISESRKGDCWLLCSDGVSGVVGGQRMREILFECAQPAESLVLEAMERGSRDNCTAVTVRIP